MASRAGITSLRDVSRPVAMRERRLGALDGQTASLARWQGRQIAALR